MFLCRVLWQVTATGVWEVRVRGSTDPLKFEIGVKKLMPCLCRTGDFWPWPPCWKMVPACLHCNMLRWQISDSECVYHLQFKLWVFKLDNLSVAQWMLELLTWHCLMYTDTLICLCYTTNYWYWWRVSQQLCAELWHVHCASVDVIYYA